MAQAQHRHHGTDAADSHRRLPASRWTRSVHDKWGLPVARFSGNVHPHTFEIGEVQAKRAEAWLKEAGAITLPSWPASRTWFPPASTRPEPAAWATIPKASVVNRNCQIHDVDNVFVIDAACTSPTEASTRRSPSWPLPTYASDALVTTGRVRDSGHEAFLEDSRLALVVALRRGHRR